MLSINLEQETESYLAEIIAQENSTSEELLKKLIHQHWKTLKPRQTIAQRRGGHPTNLLQDAAPNTSLYENCKQAILEHIQNRRSLH